MKRALLAGCALVALAATCENAVADTDPGKFDIKISGDASITAGYVKQNYDAQNTNQSGNGGLKGDLVNRFRLQITPQATANNGMEYGASFRLRAWRGDGMVDADQAYMFFDGTLGRVELGVNAGLNSQYGVSAPSGFGTGGVTGDWADGPTNGAGAASFIFNQNTYIAGVFGGEYNSITSNNPSTKINYFTPRAFAQEDAPATGLMGMLSYAPQNVSVNTSATRSPRASQTYGVLAGGANLAQGGIPNPGDSFCQFSYFSSTSVQGCAWKNVMEAGLRYDGTFNGVSLSGSAGYIHGSAGSTGGYTGAITAANPADYNTGFYDLSAYQVGFQVGYAGFLVGGSYLDAGKSGYNRNGSVYRTVAGVGVLTPVQNKTGQSSITAGFSYETGPVVVGFNYAHGQDAGDLTLAGKREANLYSVGATYTLAPGLTTSLEYLRSITKNQNGFTELSGDYIAGNSTWGSSNASMLLWKNVVTF